MDVHGDMGLSLGLDMDRSVVDSLYDTLRWLDHDHDLDLRLSLDNHVAAHDVGSSAAMTKRRPRPPSRHALSLSKTIFGRPSLSLNRPDIKDVLAQPCSSALPKMGAMATTTPTPARRLSLIASKVVVHAKSQPPSLPATHYQDPDARLKLRNYLASPQKFDEVIEFGFPSGDTLSSGTTARDAEDTAFPTLYLDDHDHVLCSFDSDAAKPLQTIHNRESCASPVSADSVDLSPSPHLRLSDSSSREMTIRMTLTRADLRAAEEQIYGRRRKITRPRHLPPLLPSLLPSCAGRPSDDSSSFDTLDRPAIPRNPWEADLPNRGVMKRMWDRVRGQA